MKKLVFTLALVVMGFTATYAQKQREKLTPEQRAEKEATAMQQKLSLSADQKVKIQAIQLERIKNIEELRNADQTDVKAKMAERKAFAKASNTKLEAILTADQKKTWDASKAERKGKMKKRTDENGTRGPKGSKREKTLPPPMQNN